MWHLGRLGLDDLRRGRELGLVGRHLLRLEQWHVGWILLDLGMLPSDLELWNIYLAIG